MKELIVLVLLISSGTASAVPVLWTIHDAVFEDGTVLTGSFVFDADLMNNASYTDYSGDTHYYAAGYTEVNIDYEPFPDGPDGLPFAEPPPFPVIAGYTVEYVNCYDSPGCYTTVTDSDALFLNYYIWPFSYWEYPDNVDITLAFDHLTNEGGYRELGGFLLRGYTNLQSGYLIGTVVPIPAAVWLFGSALAGLGWIRRRQTA
jgi:hypothetical protein